MTQKQDSWVVKNIFSLIALLITVGGMIAGYTRLEVAVSDLKSNKVDKEVIRQVATEVMVDKMALMQKDISFLKDRIDRMEENVKVLFRRNGREPVVMSPAK